LARLIRSGVLTYVEHIYEGLETSPQALADLYAGRNEHKVLVRIDRESG
jgi:NADPH-dependent curcumin reductase CurA